MQFRNFFKFAAVFGAGVFAAFVFFFLFFGFVPKVKAEGLALRLHLVDEAPALSADGVCPTTDLEQRPESLLQPTLGLRNTSLVLGKGLLGLELLAQRSLRESLVLSHPKVLDQRGIELGARLGNPVLSGSTNHELLVLELEATAESILLGQLNALESPLPRDIPLGLAKDLLQLELPAGLVVKSLPLDLDTQVSLSLPAELLLTGRLIGTPTRLLSAWAGLTNPLVRLNRGIADNDGTA